MSCCHCCKSCNPHISKNIRPGTCTICPRLGKICKFQHPHINSNHDKNIFKRFRTEAFDSGSRGISFNNLVRAQSPISFTKIQQKKQLPKPYSASKSPYMRQIRPIITQQLVHHQIIQPIISYNPIYYNVDVPVQLPTYNKIINKEIVVNRNKNKKNIEFHYQDPKLINSRSTVDRSNWLKFSSQSKKSRTQNSPIHPNDLKNMVSSFLAN